MLPTPRSRKVSLSALLSLALVIALPAALHAQGGLLKKAKNKLAGKPAEETGPPPEFNDTVLELTAERIDKVLKGVAAGRQVKSPDGLGVPELQQRADEAYQKRNKLMDGRDKELSAFNEAESKYDQCVFEEMQAIRKRRDKEMEARMAAMRPEDMQMVQEMSIEIGQKLAAGDTTGAMKAQERLMAKFGGDASGDSAAARAKCGKAPARPDWLVKADEQLRIANDSLEQARRIETGAIREQARAAGLTEVQFGIARERMAAWVSADGRPSRSWRFSKEERQILSERKDEIQSAL